MNDTEWKRHAVTTNVVSTFGIFNAKVKRWETSESYVTQHDVYRRVLSNGKVSPRMYWRGAFIGEVS